MSDNDKTLNEIVSTLISERKEIIEIEFFRVFVIILFSFSCFWHL